MPELKTLIKDVYAIAGKVPLELKTKIEPHIPKGTLRLSQMGPRCPRALWYSVHHPELEEKMHPAAYVKFNFGHMIEALALEYAKLAGHEVVGEQDVLTVDGVEGHRDCVIDGCLVDVKSASSPSFVKFSDGSISENDTFGYLDQLDGYLVACADDPLVKVKDRAWLWAVDKQLGHMVLYEHRLREHAIKARIAAYKRIVEADQPPPCECGVVADGESGNLKLDTRASYNTYKYCCFPSLRTFLYADGPRYLTRVVKQPTRRDRKTPIPEVDKNGVII